LRFICSFSFFGAVNVNLVNIPPLPEVSFQWLGEFWKRASVKDIVHKGIDKDKVLCLIQLSVVILIRRIHGIQALSVTQNSE
jgi:hypothetical protein